MTRLPCAVLLALAATACRSGREEGGTEARPASPAPAAEAAGAGDAGRGFELLAERACTACHASELVAAEPAPRLELAGARLTPAALDSALSAGPRMPDCLAPLSEAERAPARAALVHFLAARGGPLEPSALESDAQSLERGRQLYHSIGCVACHEPFETAATLAKPLWEFPESFEPGAPAAEAAGTTPRDPRSLRGLGARTTLDALARLLADPLAVHPSGRMPSLALDAREARDVAAYLLYEDELGRGARLAYARGGLALDYFEGSFPDETVDFDALAPVRSETATSFFRGIARREDGFGLRFRGFLHVDVAGAYTFTTRSDDGSMLYVDGRLVVDNRGQHSFGPASGETRLDAGVHALEVTYFENAGDEALEVAWSGPGRDEEPLSFELLSRLVLESPPLEASGFALDARAVELGRELYGTLGCASCHEAAAPLAAPLAELDPRRGCLADAPSASSPSHRLTPAERADLAAALRARTPPERSAEQRLAAELARLGCVACHERGGAGGPDDAKRPYFQVADGLDLGDEGRLPPSLARTGAKLRPAWLASVLDGTGRARPYMRTRMPRFGSESVAGLGELFAEADAALRDEREPEFTPEAVEAGKRLAGTKGLGCIQCHELAGHPSIGIPAVDLARVHERIWPGWFRELLMDPDALRMNARMPSFWVDGRSPVADVLEGDPARQVDALWTYLSLGSAMPLPHGLVPREGEYEVEVYDEPVCVGVFMDGVSPRTVAVGLPERVHYAFDVQNSRLALAWRGRFFDARGTWHGRAGQLERPAGEDVLEFPQGPAFAVLAKPDDPWPGGPGSFRALGRTLDAERRPAFRYALGSVTITDAIGAEVRSGGAVLRRSTTLHSSTPGAVLDMRVAVGDSIAPEGEKTWRIDSAAPSRIRVTRGGGELSVVAGADGRAELRARIPIGLDFALVQGVSRQQREASLIELEYSW